MTRISVPYMVPVQVIVNTDTGTVERVTVIDESIVLDESENAFWENADKYKPITNQEERDGALALAESVDWPAWEHGY